MWQVTQHNAANRNQSGFDKRIRVFCQINPETIHRNGYKVIYGKQDNPEFNAANGMMSAQYLHLVGKIGMDCAEGWYALVNGTHGYVFVERFNWQPEAKYPDDASFELWTQGTGSISAYGKEVTMPNSIEENPYVLETEVLSPFASLKPGESSSYHSDWYVTKIGGDFPVVACTNVGVTCNPLTVIRDASRLIVLSGLFGVFDVGEAAFVFIDKEGNEIFRTEKRAAVSPKRPLTHEELRGLAEGLEVPSNADQLSLIVFARSGKTVGQLAAAKISR
jgi:hypothetical protein